MKKSFPNLLKAAKKNLAAVSAYAALDDAQKATYDNSFDRRATIGACETALNKANNALDAVLAKADAEVRGKSFAELSAVLKDAGYDAAVLDFFSEAMAA